MIIITNAKYTKDIVTEENSAISATINGQAVSVPLDEANTDYQNILKWVLEGNTIEEAD